MQANCKSRSFLGQADGMLGSEAVYHQAGTRQNSFTATAVHGLIDLGTKSEIVGRDNQATAHGQSRFAEDQFRADIKRKNRVQNACLAIGGNPRHRSGPGVNPLLDTF